MNGYVCFYNRQRIEVRAGTALEAQRQAAAQFKVKANRAYQIAVVLAEVEGKPVSIAPESL